MFNLGSERCAKAWFLIWVVLAFMNWGNCFRIFIKNITASSEGVMVIFSSGWRDLNSRPLGPEPSALTGLRYTPKIIS